MERISKISMKGKQMSRLRNLWYILVISCFILWTTASSVICADQFLRIGSKGRLVIEVQGYLQRLNYLRQRPSGYYSRVTAEAIKSFQLEHALNADGIVGPETLTAFQMAINDKIQTVEHTVAPDETLAGIAQQYNSSIAAIMIKNKLSGNEVTVGQKLIIPSGGSMTRLASRGRVGGIQTIPWSIVDQLWEVGKTATIIDVETGKSFQARRLYGLLHADVEPLTKHDTETMLTIYGGKWSWARRAVVVQMRNLFIAASINGMPHGQKSIAGNGFPGQFCTHFLGSRVHESGTVDPEHLAMIEKAVIFNLNSLNFKNEPVKAGKVIVVGKQNL
jgi:LysM repeat protein